MFKFLVLFVGLVLLVSQTAAFSPKGHGTWGTRTVNSVARVPTTLKAVVECQQGDFEKDVIKSSSEGPVIVDFYADWCGPCKIVVPIFKSLSDELTDIKFVKVNTDVHENEVDNFNIQGLPLFGLFVNGKMVASHSGALSKEPLRTFISKSAESAKSA